MPRETPSRWAWPATNISSLAAAAAVCLLLAHPGFAAEHAAAPQSIPGAPVYVPFPVIFVPIIEGDKVARQVGVTLTLELAKGAPKDGVESKRLQLNNAFVENLYSFFQQRSEMHDSIDQAYLKQRLLRAAAAVVGPKVVQEVLIEQLFVEQR